jgi:hypothetical protein
MAAFDSSPEGKIEVKLDGLLIQIPPERRSLTAIHSYLELLALDQQRILCSLAVDGEPMNLTHPKPGTRTFAQVEAETMGLNEVPAQLIKAALQQTTNLRSRVQSAIELILINDIGQARELWWTISTALKEPLLTLSLLPEDICGPDNGRASLMQLRKWQLQQLGRIIQDVDEVCRSTDPVLISDALERRAVPWLDQLLESLRLWQEIMFSDPGSLCSEGSKSLPS